MNIYRTCLQAAKGNPLASSRQDNE